MAETVTTAATARYALSQRWLHWIIAGVVLGNLMGGSLLWAYGFEGLRDSVGIELTNAIYKYHKTFGVIVLALMALRIVLRAGLGAPALPASIPAWQATIAAATHYAAYALLIAIPVLGWLATGAGGFPVEFFDMRLPGIVSKDKALSETLFFLHGAAAGLLVVVLGAHIGAALRHWLVLKDGIIHRISLR